MLKAKYNPSAGTLAVDALCADVPAVGTLATYVLVEVSITADNMFVDDLPA